MRLIKKKKITDLPLSDEEYFAMEKSNDRVIELYDAAKEVMRISKPNYYAILPAKIRYDENLSHLEKLLYAEITAMAQKPGYCYATNEYFMKNFGNSERSISGSIAHLAELGYISLQFEKRGGNKGDLRKIFINFNKMGEPVEVAKNCSPRQQESATSETEKEGVPTQQKGQKEEGNNTRDNNTSILYSIYTPPDEEVSLPSWMGKTAHLRILSLYEMMWKHKFGTSPAKIKIQSPESAAVKRLLQQFTEPFAAMVVIIHFEWKGTNGDDERQLRRLENAGFPLTWLPRNAPLYFPFIKNQLQVTTNKEAAERVCEAIEAIR